MFSLSFSIADLKNSFTGNLTASPSDSITIAANASIPLATVTFNEYRRAFVMFRSWDPTVTSVIAYANPSYYGNNTVTLKALVFGKIVVSGIYFYANSPVKLYVGTTLLGTVNTNATGFFNTTFTVPILPIGSNNIEVLDGNNVPYYFTLNVQPTLILSPSEGPVGTLVTATAYGFPANTAVYLYWKNITYSGPAAYKWLSNATTGADGTFNVTVTFTVPHTYGGDHIVNASTNYPSPLTSIASAIFTVTPQLSIMSAPFGNTGATHWIVGTGLSPAMNLALLVDNTLMNIVRGNGTGDFAVPLIDAGFRPGLHVVSVMDWNVSSGFPTFYANATFFVTATGDVIASQFASILAQLSNVSAQLGNMNAVLTQVAGDVAVIKTDSGYVRVKVDDLMALLSGVNATVSTVAGDVSGIKSDVAVIKSNVGTIMTSVNNLAFLLNAVGARIVSIQNDTATLKTNVGTIMATLPALNASITAVGNNVVAIQTSVGTLQGTVTDVKNGVATISTDVGTIKADVSTIKGNVSALQSSVSAVQDVASAANSNAASASSTAQTTMWLVVLTFIISLVSLVFIFRRK